VRASWQQPAAIGYKPEIQPSNIGLKYGNFALGTTVN
jgi:hypothetical protein